MKELLIAILLILAPFVGRAQELPIPHGLKAELVEGDSGRHIRLTWNKLQDLGTPLGYNLLVKFPYSSSLLLYQKAGVIYDSIFYFPINEQTYTVYDFALMSISNFPTVKRSRACAAISKAVPSTSLPNITINKIEYQNGEITLSWDYKTSIGDLKGYVIYLNNKAVASVNDAEQSIWSGGYKEKGTYVFEISAITTSGLESRRSQKKSIKIE